MKTNFMGSFQKVFINTFDLDIDRKTETFHVFDRSKMNAGMNDRFLCHWLLFRTLGQKLESSKKACWKPASSNV